jgi:hypothetical protein
MTPTYDEENDVLVRFFFGHPNHKWYHRLGRVVFIPPAVVTVFLLITVLLTPYFLYLTIVGVVAGPFMWIATGRNIIREMAGDDSTALAVYMFLLILFVGGVLSSLIHFL